MQHDQLPQLLKKAEVCTRLSISFRTLENMVKAGEFPPPVPIGKYVYWSDKALCLWQEKKFADQERWGAV